MEIVFFFSSVMISVAIGYFKFEFKKIAKKYKLSYKQKGRIMNLFADTNFYKTSKLKNVLRTPKISSKSLELIMDNGIKYSVKKKIRPN